MKSPYRSERKLKNAEDFNNNFLSKFSENNNYNEFDNIDFNNYNNFNNFNSSNFYDNIIFLKNNFNFARNKILIIFSLSFFLMCYILYTYKPSFIMIKNKNYRKKYY